MTSSFSSPSLVGRIAALLAFRSGDSSPVGEPCCIPAELHVGSMPSGSDGLILQISPREILFREASHFLLDRTGSRVHVSFMSSQVAGTITASRPGGYRIQLANPLEDDLVAALLDDYGVDADVA